jgi:hypothetical protein
VLTDGVNNTRAQRDLLDEVVMECLNLDELREELEEIRHLQGKRQLSKLIHSLYKKLTLVSNQCRVGMTTYNLVNFVEDQIIFYQSWTSLVDLC